MTISMITAANRQSKLKDVVRRITVLKYTIIWVLGLAIALVSGLIAMGAIAKSKAPELAIILQPSNGFAAEKLASASVKAAVSANQGRFVDHTHPTAVRLAKQAFLSEPVTPEAITVLALSFSGDKERKLMHRAVALSRRQQLATSWMIADSGAREDIPAILGYYDTMIRTSTSAASVVIPLMARALSDKNFIGPFSSLLSKKPPWNRSFWEAVVATPESVENAVILRKQLYAPDGSQEDYRDANLIWALVKNKQFEAAEDLYQLLTDTKQKGSLVNNSSFVYETSYAPLDWQVFSTGEYGAVIASDSLKLSAIPNSGGVFARQLVKLPPRILDLEVRSDSGIPEDADLSVSLSCAEAVENRPNPIRVSLVGKLTDRKISNDQLDCKFFWFDIVGRTAENGDGFDVSINSVSLKPA